MAVCHPAAEEMGRKIRANNYMIARETIRLHKPEHIKKSALPNIRTWVPQRRRW